VKAERVRIKGGRDWKAAGFDPRIEQWINRMARRFHTSASHVIETACSEVSGIRTDDKLDTRPQALKLVKRA
jgi:hypothetical protein